ncbi:uncharacterized protein LOC131244633 [Magnolia sinica]|uniref:uncharacterized protein LOC131244633 n=1 Tax=Magnolia sinica TaxID=86752 RepID=UPI002659AD43|nr:uncharacterized protein LOC131244633 [Magnolia sinica]
MPISDPPTTPRWGDVTDDVRQLIRQRFQDKFDLNLSVPHIFNAIDDMIKERFKEYRSVLHKRCMSHEEAALSAPPHVTDDDWRILCDRFSSDSFQKRSKNKFQQQGKVRSEPHSWFKVICRNSSQHARFRH